MIVSIDLSQEIFAIGMLRALKSSLKRRRKHVLRPLQLYGDQALLADLFFTHVRTNPYIIWSEVAAGDLPGHQALQLCG